MAVMQNIFIAAQWTSSRMQGLIQGGGVGGIAPPPVFTKTLRNEKI